MDKRINYIRPMLKVLRMETNGMLADSIQADSWSETEEANSKQNSFDDWEECDFSE